MSRTVTEASRSSLDTAAVEAALPTSIVLSVALFLLALFLLTGRVPVTRTLFNIQFARRHDTPVIYWFFVLAWAGITLMIAWWAAQSAGLLDRIPPGARVMAETAAPYAAITTLVVFAVVAWTAERRRRARLRAQHPSAVERAAGDV